MSSLISNTKAQWQRNQQDQQADVDLKKQAVAEGLQRQQQNDLDFHQKMTALGANYVHDSGLVEEPMYNMGNPDMGDAAPPTNGTVIRKADPSRVVKYKTAEGDTVQYEIPTPEEQQNRGAYLRYQQAKLNRLPAQEEAAQAASAKQAESAAQTYGAGSGRQRADTEARETSGVSPTPAMGLPDGMKITPAEAVQLSGKEVPTQTRVQGQNDRQQNALGAKANSVKSTRLVVGPGGQTTQVVTYNDGTEEEQPISAVSNVKPPSVGRGAGSLTPAARAIQDRFQQRTQQKDQDRHNALEDAQKAAWESAGQIQNILDTTQDGETFVSPKTGKEVPMNKAQRTALTGTMNEALRTAREKMGESAQIRKKYGWGEFAGGQPAQPSANGPSAPGHPQRPAPQVSQAAAAPIAPGQQQQPPPQSAGGDKVRVKTGDGRTGSIPRANLKAAQQMDPTLQVMQ